MREAVRRMDRYSAQAKLVAEHKLDSIPAVEDFIAQTESRMQTVAAQRDRLYNRMRRCCNPTEMESLKAKRDQCTKALSALRREKKTAQGILADQKEIHNNIRVELALRHELYHPEKNKLCGTSCITRRKTKNEREVMYDKIIKIMLKLPELNLTKSWD